MRHLRGHRGFTLIEASVSLIVIAVLFIAGIKYYRTWTLRQAMIITNERLDTIRSMLKTHVMTVSWLPCPAPLDDAQDTATYGQQTDCMVPATPGTFEVPGRGGSLVRIGAVPVRALNLPDRYMTDAWGRRFLYAVTTEMARGPAVNYRTNDGAIFLHDLNGNSLTDVDGRGLYVLLSHGITGVGGYLANGVQFSACGAGPLPPDSENCNNDATFTISQSYSESGGNNNFDDLTRYDVKDYVPAPAISRYILDTMPCNAGLGTGANGFGENCASLRFSGSAIFDPGAVGQTVYTRTLTAQTDGTVMVRAIVPVTYDNSMAGATKWEDAIMGALEIDGTVVARGILVDPARNSNLSAGWSGMVLGSAPIVKGTDYTVTVRVFSLGNNAIGNNSAWAGTIRFGTHSYDGMVEIMEGAI